MKYKEAKVKGSKTYDGRPCKYNHTGKRYVSSRACVECTAERRASWAEHNLEKVRKIYRRYYSNNREKEVQSSLLWRSKNLDKTREYSKRQYHKNPEYYIQAAVIRQRDLRKRMLNYVAEDFYEIYNSCRQKTLDTGIPHHVDHIIPLKGRTVCGLHVPNNLQIILAAENLKKHNKVFQ